MILNGPTMSTAQIANAERNTPIVENASPLTGATVTMTGGSADTTMALSPAGTLVTLTVILPANATSLVGDVARITTTKAITTITISGATAIPGNIITMAVNEAVAFKKLADNLWMNIQ